jgi:outer membrane biosynthesis protein TonB
MRGPRIFISAMAISLLLHLMALGNANLWWSAPAYELPFAIEAQIQMLATEMVATPTPPPPPALPLPSPADIPPLQPKFAKVEPSQQPQQAPSPSPPAPLLPTEAPAEVPPQVHPQAPTEISPETPHETPLETLPKAPIPAGMSASAPDSTLPNVLRSPPAQVSLQYNLETGDDGFVIGKTTYSGQFRDGRYRLHSLTEATGVAAFFIHDKITQGSEGLITRHGLQPDRFWIERSKRQPLLARFDWVQRRLKLPRGELELPLQTQDLLSFPFHIAMLMQDAQPGPAAEVNADAWSLPVTNGNKLRQYPIRTLGRPILSLGDVAVQTLHLSSDKTSEGSIEVWLAPERDWLPLRFRMVNAKGKVTVLTLQESAN